MHSEFNEKIINIPPSSLSWDMMYCRSNSFQQTSYSPTVKPLRTPQAPFKFQKEEVVVVGRESNLACEGDQFLFIFNEFWADFLQYSLLPVQDLDAGVQMGDELLPSNKPVGETDSDNHS